MPSYGSPEEACNRMHNTAVPVHTLLMGLFGVQLFAEGPKSH